MPSKNTSPAVIGGRRRSTGGKTAKKWAANVVPGDATPIKVLSAQRTGGSGVVDVSFDVSVQLEKTPAWPVNGQLPVSAELTTPTTLRLDYQSYLASQTLDIPFQSPGVRSSSGGFVVSQAIPLAAPSAMSAQPEGEPMSIASSDVKKAA